MARVDDLGSRRERDRILRNLQARIRRVQAKIPKVRRKLKRLRGKRVPKSVIKEVEDQIAREGWMERIILERFKKEARRAAGHPKWKRLTPKYARAKERAGFGRKINVRTGRLRHRILEYVRGTWKFGERPEWREIDSVEYSKYVERVRPILLPPSRRELAPVDRRAKQLALEKMRRGVE